MAYMMRYGRFIIAGAALLVAFVLSIQFSDRGVQFDVDNTGSSAHAGPEPEGSGYNLAQAEILNKVLLQIKEKYVDPDRVNPAKMLVHGLDEVQKAVPEIVVTFDQEIDSDTSPKTATVQVDSATKTFRIGKIESLWEMSFKMKEIFRFIQDNLKETEDLKFNKIEYTAINGMLNTLDPHSVLLSPEVYKEMQTQTGGKFGGLGIVIGIRDGGLTVISPIDDTPAARAGIKAGDKIIRIEDESTVNMSLTDAVSKLRGDPDTQIAIWVTRKGWQDPKKIVITRAIIKIESVESQLLSNKVGYVKIKNFQANTFTDLRTHLESLHKKSGGLSGVVLDLRNNPGGLLDQAIKVSDTFVSDGTIVSTVGYGNKLRDENKARRYNTEPEYPIVVLLDPGSASASEIVAGALKNLNRAIIVGDTSFGKGSVQVIYELSDGSALKLTIAQYLTPGEISIQSVGIVPDIQIVPVVIDDKGVDMFQTNRITREVDLESHLDHKSVAQGKRPASILRYYKERDPEFDPNQVDDPDKFKEDFAIQLGTKLLVAAKGTWRRPEMLKKVEQSLAGIADQELDRVQGELKKIGVDWSGGKSDPQPKVSVTLLNEKGNLDFTAGDKTKLVARITNDGSQPLYRLRAVLETENEAFDEKEFIFGRVDPGQSREWSLDVEIPLHHTTRQDELRLSLGAFGTDMATTPSFTAKTAGGSRPHFAFTYFLDDSAGNGDGILQPGERVTMRLHVLNNGAGDTGKTTAYLRNLSKEALYLKQGRDEVEVIKARSDHLFEFSFDVKSLPAEGPMKVEVEVYDEVFKEFTSEELTLPAEAKAVKKVTNAGGAFKTAAKTKVLTSARIDASPVATVEAGTSLKVTAKTDDMFRVQLSDRVIGWVKAGDGAYAAGGAADAATKTMPALLRTPPTIKLDTDVHYTGQSMLRLKGLASDEAAVKDYYVFVFTTNGTKTTAKKVAYKRGGNASLAIDTDVPLSLGMNRVRVFVRDSDDMTVSETLFVYRK